MLFDTVYKMQMRRSQSLDCWMLVKLAASWIRSGLESGATSTLCTALSSALERLMSQVQELQWVWHVLGRRHTSYDKQHPQVTSKVQKVNDSTPWAFALCRYHNMIEWRVDDPYHVIPCKNDVLVLTWSIKLQPIFWIGLRIEHRYNLEEPDSMRNLIWWGCLAV